MFLFNQKCWQYFPLRLLSPLGHTLTTIIKLSSVFCLRSDDKSLENRLEKKPQKMELFSRSATLCLANCPTVRPRGLGPSLHCCSLHIGHTDKYGSNRANMTQIQYNFKKENMEECGQKYLHLLADPGHAKGQTPL